MTYSYSLKWLVLYCLRHISCLLLKLLVHHKLKCAGPTILVTVVRCLDRHEDEASPEVNLFHECHRLDQGGAGSLTTFFAILHRKAIPVFPQHVVPGAFATRCPIW